jgi:hypothetical protein
MDTYMDLLVAIKTLLNRYQVRGGWTQRLDEWIDEYQHLEPTARRGHLERTKRALAGMGSLGDIVICPQNGDTISADQTEMRSANEVLRSLLDQLYAEINLELGQQYLQ